MQNKYIKSSTIVVLVAMALVSAILGLVLPFSILIIFDRIIPNQSVHTLLFLYVIILASIILDTKVKGFEELITSNITKKFEKEITQKIFKALCYADIAKFNRFGIGEYLERIRTIPSLKNFFGGDLIKAIINLTTCLIIFSIIFIINPHAGGVVVLASLILFYISNLLSKKKVRKFEEKSTLEGSTNSKIIDIVSHPLNLKTASMEYRIENYINDAVKKREDYSVELEKLESNLPLSLGFIQQVSIALVVVSCALAVIGQNISQGSMAAIILLTNRYFTPFRQLIGAISQRRLYLMQLGRLNQILELEQNHTQNESLLDPQKITVNADLKYNFRKGNIYIINGKSCSGKSHLVNSISLNNDNCGIEISIDGNNLSKSIYSDWKNSIASVDSNSSFIEGTIIENITCFRPKLYRSAYALCEAMNIKEIIDSLPRGFYTELKGTKNYPFSRQVLFSLLIIRALLCKKAILIIDDIDLIYDKDFEHNLLRCINSRSDSMICFLVSNKIVLSNEKIIHTPISKIFNDKSECQTRKILSQAQDDTKTAMS